MSADASVEFAWADGHYRFRLALGQLRELQEKVNQPRVAIGASPIGPYSLLRAAIEKDLWLHDIREIMRLALIGGGTKPADALALVGRYVDERPILENAEPVILILTAALAGAVGDDAGKKAEAEKTVTEPSETMTGSSFPPSTEPAPPSDGMLPTSTTPPSGNS